jgi:hypothetical protein
MDHALFQHMAEMRINESGAKRRIVFSAMPGGPSSIRVCSRSAAGKTLCSNADEVQDDTSVRHNHTYFDWARAVLTEAPHSRVVCPCSLRGVRAL